MYDVIVIGARCAGSPTAMVLARKGYKVLLLDKSTFPSDTMSTHMITMGGSAQLKRWGVLEHIQATDCPPITKIMLDILFDLGPIQLTGFPPPLEDGFCATYAPKRSVLDKILIDAAVAAGVEFREGFMVMDLLKDGERVSGIRGHARNGTSVTETAHLVVGADGMRSLVARSVEAPMYATAPIGTCGYYNYWSGVPMQGIEFYLRPYRTVIAFPTNHQQTVVFVEWPHREFNDLRADVPGNFLRTVEKVAPDLAARLHAGTCEGRFMGTADLPNFFRKPYGPGWVLVGDAGCHKDPITAQGITDAFRDAEFLAQAIDAGLAGSQPLDEALAGYERRRNETFMPLYEFICDRSTLDPFPHEFQQVLVALQGNQEGTDRFFGVIENTIPFREFFSPENILTILNSATLIEPLP